MFKENHEKFPFFWHDRLRAIEILEIPTSITLTSIVYKKVYANNLTFEILRHQRSWKIAEAKHYFI